eukprot:GSChrysophyteH2.ASY1.ANO1.1594.1 assembled CDS
MASFDAIQHGSVLVADIGSTTARIGFAGDDQPRAHFHSAVGVVDGEEAVAMDKQYHHDIFNYRDDMEIKLPVQDGLVVDFDSYENMWHHALTNTLKMSQAQIKDTPFIISEKSFTSSADRTKITELFFDKFDVSSLFISKDAVLSCYACGRTTGLVCDFGGGGTTVTPVSDGWVDPKGLNRSAVSGRWLDAQAWAMARAMKGKGNAAPLPSYHKSLFKKCRASYEAYMELDFAREMKEAISHNGIYAQSYELPDGQVVDIGVKERHACAELLFEPSHVPWNSTQMHTLGLHLQAEGLACDSFYRCSHDQALQSNLLSNVIVSGGNSVFDNLPGRLQNEMEIILQAAVPSARVKTIATAPNERSICPWLGASILGSLGSGMNDITITRKEYKEHGANIVEKKCP